MIVVLLSPAGCILHEADATVAIARLHPGKDVARIGEVTEVLATVGGHGIEVFDVPAVVARVVLNNPPAGPAAAANRPLVAVLQNEPMQN